MEKNIYNLEGRKHFSFSTKSGFWEYFLNMTQFSNVLFVLVDKLQCANQIQSESQIQSVFWMVHELRMDFTWKKKSVI